DDDAETARVTDPHVEGTVEVLDFAKPARDVADGEPQVALGASLLGVELPETPMRRGPRPNDYRGSVALSEVNARTSSPLSAFRCANAVKIRWRPSGDVIVKVGPIPVNTQSLSGDPLAEIFPSPCWMIVSPAPESLDLKCFVPESESPSGAGVFESN